MRTVLLFSILAILPGASADATGPVAVFEEVPEGEFAIDVSADGSFLAGSDAFGRPARFDADLVAEAIGPLPGAGRSGAARGISADGSVVVGNARSAGPEYFEAFRWEDGVIEGLGVLPEGHIPVQANGVSEDGTTVVGIARTVTSGPKPFVWRRETGARLLALPPDAGWSWAMAANTDGSTIVGRVSIGGWSWAAKWVDGVLTLLDDLPGGARSGWAHDVTPDGRIAVGQSGSTPGYQAVLWDGVEARPLGDLAGDRFSSRALAVSADGRLVGGDADYGSVDVKAFIWDPHNGMRDLRVLLEDHFGLDLGSWQLFRVEGISANGRVLAGPGRTDERFFAAWRVILPPACADTLDNDGDGRADLPDDPGCLSLEDETEGSRDDVVIDVAPFGRTGRVLAGGPPTLSLAILASGSFDPSTVALDTLRFGPGAAPVVIHGPDPTRPPSSLLRDVDGDRLRDLVVRFAVAETGLSFGDPEACLVGEAEGLGFRACAPVEVRPIGCAGGNAAALPGACVLLLALRARPGRWGAGAQKARALRTSCDSSSRSTKSSTSRWAPSETT